MIEIPDKDIPERQDIISVDLCFVGRKVGQCTYPFEILTQEPIEVLQEIRQEIEEKERRIELKNDPPDAWWVKWNVCLDECLAIIDKHLEQYKEDAG
jgi:hypothetical protein